MPLPKIDYSVHTKPCSITWTSKPRHNCFADLLYTLSSLLEGKIPFHFIKPFGEVRDTKLKKKIRSYLNKQKEKSFIFNTDKAKLLLNLPVDNLQKRPADDLIQLYQELLDSYQFRRQNYSQYVAYLEPAQKWYVKGMMEFRNVFPTPMAMVPCDLQWIGSKIINRQIIINFRPLGSKTIK